MRTSEVTWSHPSWCRRRPRSQGGGGDLACGPGRALSPNHTALPLRFTNQPRLAPLHVSCASYSVDEGTLVSQEAMAVEPAHSGGRISALVASAPAFRGDAGWPVSSLQVDAQIQDSGPRVPRRVSASIPSGESGPPGFEAFASRVFSWVPVGRTHWFYPTQRNVTEHPQCTSF